MALSQQRREGCYSFFLVGSGVVNVARLQELFRSGIACLHRLTPNRGTAKKVVVS
jgi:hypothetical protein